MTARLALILNCSIATYVLKSRESQRINFIRFVCNF